MPLMASSRLVSLTHNGENSLDINNLPFDYEGEISIPLDVMSLTLEEENYVTGTSEVSMSWNLDNLPEHIDLALIDNLTGEIVYLNNEISHSFTTEPKGSFSASYDGAVGIYPLLGDARFSVQVSYGLLDNAPVKVIPKDYALSPVYPNPFNPTTKIRYDIPEASVVTLSIYNLMGKEVRTLTNSEQKAGFKNVQWNATNDQGKPVPAGVYIYSIQAGEFRQTKKMILLK